MNITRTIQSCLDRLRNDDTRTASEPKEIPTTTRHYKTDREIMPLPQEFL